MQNPELATDFYQVLGVPPSASHEDVQRAYFRLSNIYSHEKHPETYQKLKQAYETLSDSRARHHYNALWSHNDETKQLMTEAIRSMTDGNYIGASRRLKEILVRNSRLDEALDLLGFCQAQLGLTDDALNTYSMLVEKRPDVPLYWIRYGDVFLEKAENSPESDRKPLIGSARSRYRKAFTLDPQSTAPYLAIARTYMEEKKYDQALNWVEKNVRSIESPTFEDFDAMFYLLNIHGRVGNSKKVMEVAKRIEDLVPDDDDVKQYVATKFAQTATELIKSKFFKASKQFLNLASKFDSDCKDLDELHEKVDTIIEAEAMWKNIEKDSNIIKPIKTLAALKFVHYSGHKSDDEYESGVKSVIKKLDNFTPPEIKRSIEILKYSYTHYYNLDRDLWKRIVHGSRPESTHGRDIGYSPDEEPDEEVQVKKPKKGVPKELTDPLAKPKKEAIDRSILIGAGAGIILAIIGFLVLKLVGTVAGAILGYALGAAIGRAISPD